MQPECSVPGAPGESFDGVLLAKRAESGEQTLLEHTQWALRSLREMLRRPAVQARTDWLGIPLHLLARSAFLAVAFHDAGKASRSFQQSIRRGRPWAGLGLSGCTEVFSSPRVWSGR